MYDCLNNISEQQQHVYYIKEVMVIVLRQAVRLRMAHALLKFAQILNKILLQVLDVDNILINVLLMAQNVFNSQLAKQLNKQ